jgi:hypothetical protein
MRGYASKVFAFQSRAVVELFREIAMERDEEIEQILNTGETKLKLWGEEKERCREFLWHIKNVAIPNERVDEERRGLPQDKPSPLEARFEAARANSWQLEYLLGDFWETMFCDKASDMGFYTHLLQRYKIYGRAHTSYYIAIAGKERDDIPLPDVEVYQLGRGLVAHIDVRHIAPFQVYPCFSIGYYEEKSKLFGNSSFYFAVHTYLPFDLKDWQRREFRGWKEHWTEHAEEYNSANKWAVSNRDKDWIVVRVTPDMELEPHGGYDCISLKQFKPLRVMLEELDNAKKS